MSASAVVAGLALVIGAMACGDGNRTTSPTPNPGGSTGGATIRITSGGASPQAVTIVRGQQVTFVNNDTRPHDIRSDPHPGLTDCPEINQVGQIQPGNNRQTGNLMVARTCGFHDHGDPGNGSVRGTITVQ